MSVSNLSPLQSGRTSTKQPHDHICSSRQSLQSIPINVADEEAEKQQAAMADARREETGQFRLDGAGTFLFFDADDSAAQKKKRKAATYGDGGGKAKGKKK